METLGEINYLQQRFLDAYLQYGLEEAKRLSMIAEATLRKWYVSDEVFAKLYNDAILKKCAGLDVNSML